MLGLRGPVPQKRDGPSRRVKLPANCADFDDREGLGTTHSKPPVMVA